MSLTSQINIIPGQSGTYRHSRERVTALLADSGLILSIVMFIYLGVALFKAEWF
jgi:hypothetical protein